MVFYAIMIALAASFGEVISKYESKVLRDIINFYLLLYLGINGFFAYATYYFLPDIARFILKPEYVNWAQGDTWGRVLISAFGYMVIARAKFITVKDIPIGIDTLYDAFTKYCLKHTNIRIINRQEQILSEVYQRFHNLKHYQEALEMRRLNLSAQEQKDIKDTKELIVHSTELEEHIKCRRLGELLLRIVGTKEELIKALESIPDNQIQPVPTNNQLKQ